MSLYRVNSHLDKTEEEEEDDSKPKRKGRGKKDMVDLDSDEDYDDDLSDLGDEAVSDEDFESGSKQKNTESKSAALPDVSQVNIKD